MPQSVKAEPWFDLARLGPVSPAGLRLDLHAHDIRKDLAQLFPLVLEKVELLVFRYHVGFLVFHYRNAEPDATKRKVLYSQLNDYILDQAFCNCFSLYPSIIVTSPRVQNLDFTLASQLSYPDAWLA